MRGKTLCIVYLSKTIELLGITILTVFQIVLGSLLILKLRENDQFYLPLMIMIPISFVLCLFHLFYNNLLINWRFQCKMKHHNLGKYCMFDGLNYLMCYCFLVKPCRDRCFTPWTIVKWILYAGYFGVLAFMVYSWKIAKA
jgi:hypothetical protein